MIVDEFISKTYMLALTACSQTELETLCRGQIILENFHVDYPHVSISSPLSFRHKRLIFSVFFVRISTKLIKRSDNASVPAGHCTIQCEKILSDTIGIKLLMRDYSEVQYGKSVCDRISGSAKLRMRAFINAGNDVVTAHDIKKKYIDRFNEF